MAPVTVFRLILIGIGIGAMFAAVLALARRKMTETLCLVWGFLALVFIAAGILLHPAGWKQYLSNEGLALIVIAGVCLLTAAYFISVGISDLLCRMRETAIQISLLRLESELLKNGEGKRKDKDLLVIIPAFNEEDNLPVLLRGLKEEGVGTFADVLVIDDGSTDRTHQKAQEMSCLCISGIFHQGYGSALLTGYKYAVKEGYSYVIQMDADGQHDICNIRALYKALQEKDDAGRRPDIVLGSRFMQGGSAFPVSRVRMFAIRIFRLFLQIAAGRRITDPTSGLQGLNSRTAAFYSRYGCFDNEYPDANIILQMLFLGYEIREIPAVMHARRSGKSMHSGIKPLIYMFRMAFSMSAVYIRKKLLRKEWVADEECVERDV